MGDVTIVVPSPKENKGTCSTIEREQCMRRLCVSMRMRMYMSVLAATILMIRKLLSNGQDDRMRERLASAISGQSESVNEPRRPCASRQSVSKRIIERKKKKVRNRVRVRGELPTACSVHVNQYLILLIKFLYYVAINNL